MNNSTTLIFGASGQLGHCIRAVAAKRGVADMVFLKADQGNILDANTLEQLFIFHKPRYIVNCAAYTAVDKAETDAEAAGLVNKTGPENLAKICKKFSTTFIHVSTDFVFAGNTTQLLTEDDVAEPINIYGLTKLQGEQLIRQHISKYFILRTSWLYSEYGNNFVKTMLNLARQKDELNVIADQVGTPTYALDLAGAILDIISIGSTNYGVYNYSNEGVASWYDFAVAIFDISGKNTKVLPIRTEQYPTPAQRPRFSVLDKSKFKRTFNISIPHWRASLVQCINQLQP